MCIVFVYSGSNDEDSDYSLILATNRDEIYDRPAKNAAPWCEDPTVFGGRDMESGCEGGTWMAISPQRRKLGLLLNLPGNSKQNAKSRGKIVENYVKSDSNIEQYAESIKTYCRETNDFVLVSVEFGTNGNRIQTYNNVTDKLENYCETYKGFSNSLPDTPLKKVGAGISQFKEVCSKLKKLNMKNQLIKELVTFLKWDTRHLPDAELQRRNPNKHENLSSVFVAIPEVRYGTRTHSIVLVTKTGHVNFIEITMEPCPDVLNTNWKKSEYEFSIPQFD